VEIYDGLLGLLGQGRLPWLTTLDAIKSALTGDIAKAIGSIAVVIGGMMVAFGEGGAKRTVAGLLLGLGIALTAVNFVNWMASL
jgi:type IV secretory pathway VirB2 component (pilin)